MPGDRHVEGLPGVLDAADGKLFLRPDDLHPGAILNAGRRDIVLIELPTWRALILIKQIGEHRAIAFKPGGVDVRQVVGNRGHFGVLRRQAGFTDP